MDKEMLIDFLNTYGVEQVTTEHGLYNPYHMENILLTHTLLVYDAIRRYIDKYGYKHTENEKKILLLAALLHDIGKPATIESVHGRTVFPNHHFLSSLKAIDFAKKYLSDHTDILKLAVVIFYHTTAHASPKLLDLLPHDMQCLCNILEYADKKGRLVNHDIVKCMSNPIIHKPKCNGTDENKRLILLHGPPMSGKTQYATNLANKLNGYLVSMDVAKQQSRQSKHLNKEDIFNNMKQKAHKYDVIVVDMTNLSLTSRNNFRAIFPNRITELHMLFRGYDEILDKLLKVKDLSYIRDPNKYITDILDNATTPTSEERFDKVKLVLTGYDDKDKILTTIG